MKKPNAVIWFAIVFVCLFIYALLKNISPEIVKAINFNQVSATKIALLVLIIVISIARCVAWRERREWRRKK